jgi:hypothetical protein
MRNPVYFLFSSVNSVISVANKGSSIFATEDTENTEISE